jgi:hypothetical protein
MLRVLYALYILYCVGTRVLKTMYPYTLTYVLVEANRRGNIAAKPERRSIPYHVSTFKTQLFLRKPIPVQQAKTFAVFYGNYSVLYHVGSEVLSAVIMKASGIYHSKVVCCLLHANFLVHSTLNSEHR